MQPFRVIQDTLRLYKGEPHNNKETMTDFEQVVEFLHGTTNRTIFRTKADYDGLYTIGISEVKVKNKEACVYWLPSRGGIKKSEITDFPLFYADLDVGKDEHENYFTAEVVRDRKVLLLRRIRLFPFKPSLIVETRNGYQVYWRLSDRPDVTTWKTIQAKIRTMLHSDPAAESPHQPMRLPCTWWRKTTGGNHPPYFVEVLEQNDLRFTFQRFVDMLDDVEIARKPSQAKSITIGCADIKFDTSNAMIAAIIRGDVAYLQSRLQPNQRQFQTYHEVHNYLTTNISLVNFLGVKEPRCRCPFHDDNNPSAGIKKLDSGQEYFHCFACGVKGNIRSIVQLLQGCSHKEALTFLMDVFQIKWIDTEWQRNQRDNLSEIARIVVEDLPEYDEALHQNVAPDLPLMLVMIEIAKRNVYSEEHTSISNGRPVFFTSIRYLQKTLGQGARETVFKRVVNLSLHGLIHRCTDSEIPPFLLEKSELYKKSLAEYCTGGEHISYYTIPDMGILDLRFSADRAARARDAGFQRGALSFDGICRTFGENVAKNVYVHRPGRRISRYSKERTEMMHEIAGEIIESKGWVTEHEIIEAMTEHWSKTLCERQVKRSMPEMLEAYGWVRVRVKKPIQKRLGITVSGHQIIILDRGRYESAMLPRRGGRPRKPR